MDEQFKQKLKDVTDWLRQEFSGIRTGEAAPAILDSVKVEAYGAHVPINQVASVGVEDAKTLRISPFDKSVSAAIERAITDANLGVSVVTDDSGLRVIFPDLTSERREQLVKLAKNKLEDARVSVRSARDEVMKVIENQEKNSEISEDEKYSLKEQVQELVDETNKTLENMMENKESEITK